MNSNKIIAALSVLGALSSPAYATQSVTPTSYKVDVKRVELCTAATGGECTTLGSGVQEFDIAAATVGTAVANYIESFSLPEDKIFTHIRTTVSRSIDITAIATTEQDGAADDLCSTGGSSVVTAASATQALGQITANGTASEQTFVVPNTDASNADANQAALYSAQGITLLNSSDMLFTKALTAPLDTSSPTPPGTVDIAFSTANTITFTTANATDCFVNLAGAPTMTITIE